MMFFEQPVVMIYVVIVFAYYLLLQSLRIITQKVNRVGK